MSKNKKPELLQGTLDMLVLKALSLGAMHGYGVGQRIQQLADDMLKVEEGTLYPALYRLERQGLVSSSWKASDNNRRARYYELTAAGRQQLVAEHAKWERLSRAVDLVMGLTTA